MDEREMLALDPKLRWAIIGPRGQDHIFRINREGVGATDIGDKAINLEETVPAFLRSLG